MSRVVIMTFAAAELTIFDGCFQAKTGVSSSYDDILALERNIWVRRDSIAV
jgi:hypothetical protein